jgi:hypothetical protein
MKNKKFFVVAACVFVLSVILGGCSVSAELVGNMIAPWEQGGLETPEPEITLPIQTPGPLPSKEAEITPAASEEPGPATTGGLNSLMLFGADDINYIKDLWPLETYGPEDLGGMSSVFISYGDSFLYLSYTLDSQRPSDEIVSELKDYITGTWETYESGASVYSGTAEGITTDCSIAGYGDSSTITLTFSLSGNYDGVNDVLDRHWPEGAMDMPPEMEGDAYSRCAMLDPIMIYISYEWKLSGYADTFRWFRTNMSGMDGFTYSPASETEDEMIEFKIEGADVRVSVSEIYGSLIITFMSYPEDFTLGA